MIFVTKVRLVVLRVILIRILSFLNFLNISGSTLSATFHKKKLIQNTEKKHAHTAITNTPLISTTEFKNV